MPQAYVLLVNKAEKPYRAVEAGWANAATLGGEEMAACIGRIGPSGLS